MTPGARGSRITGEERERLMLVFVRRYRAGESIQALASEAGHPETVVESLLREAGVALRRRGPGAGRRPATSDPATSDPAVEPTLTDPPAEADPQDPSRDLDRSPAPLTDWGLPTPPLRILVKKKDKAREKELAAATVKAHRKRRRSAAGDAAATGDGSGKKLSAKKSDKKKHAKKSGHQ